MGRLIEKGKTALVATASGGVGFTLAGFLLRDWDFSGWRKYVDITAQPIATLATGIAAVIAALITWFGGQKTRKQNKEHALRERLTSIVEMISTNNKDFIKRESGAYALAALADDWATFYKDDPKSALQEQQVCLDILTNQLRDSIPMLYPSPQLLFFKERVQNIILSKFENQQNKKKGPWSDLRLDLSNCHLYNLHTEGIFNQLACFNHAVFKGKTSFSNAVFKNTAAFEGAVFCGESFFTGTKFNEISYFTKAKFQNWANFENTKFLKDVLFGVEPDRDYADGAEFQKNASFIGVKFLGEAVHFRHCIFKENAYFTASQFHGRAVFRDATFCKSLKFNKALFSQGKESPDIQYIMNELKVDIKDEQLNIGKKKFPKGDDFLSYRELI